MGCRVGWFPLSIEYDCYGLLNILFLTKSFFCFSNGFCSQSLQINQWIGVRGEGQTKCRNQYPFPQNSVVAVVVILILRHFLADFLQICCGIFPRMSCLLGSCFLLGFHYRLFVFYFLLFNFALVFEFDKDMQKNQSQYNKMGRLKMRKYIFFCMLMSLVLWSSKHFLNLAGICHILEFFPFS